MTKRGAARGGGESGKGGTAPTVQAVPARPTPGPGPATDAEIDSTADTHVASRSQRMAAITPSSPVAELDSQEIEALDTLVGTMLEQRYQISRQIGKGGMGAVYEATHTLIGKRVAVKVLLDKYAQKDQIVARLEQEARLASSIGHPNIIDITDIGQTTDGRMFVVMEFLDGESLGALIARSGRLDSKRALRIARQIAGALGAAHAKGIVHRDVKPENVFLTKRDKGKDFVKVVDFGISKSLRPEGGGSDSPRLTQTGMVLGTPLYMSPEQARGDEELDHRIDVYALGVILYEMVTGEVPYRGTNYLNILSQVISEEPPPPSSLVPDIDPDLETVILKALDKDRDQRYQTMDEMARDLDALIEDSAASTGMRITASRRRRKGKRSSLKIVWWLAGVSVICAAVAITVKLTLSDTDNKPAPQPVAAMTIDAGPVRPPIDSAPEVAEPAADLAEVRIESDPPGVLLFDGERTLGFTPRLVKFSKQRESVELKGTKSGYEEGTITINPTVDDGSVVPMTLEKIEDKSPRRRGPARRRGAGGKDKGGDDKDTSTSGKNTVGGELLPPSRKKN